MAMPPQRLSNLDRLIATVNLPEVKDGELKANFTFIGLPAKARIKPSLGSNIKNCDSSLVNNMVENFMSHRRWVIFIAPIYCTFGLWLGLSSAAQAQASPHDWAKNIEQQRREKDKAYRGAKDSPLPEKAKKSFRGLLYFPIQEKFRFTGAITRYDKRETFDIIASDGEKRKTRRYGYFDFQLHGKTYRLQVYKLLDLEPKYSKLLFIPFLDATSGRESYGGGRYLDLEEQKQNLYTVDFNRAYNPSCAYGKSGYSCPIPPAENRLPVRIEAGEKNLEH